MSDLPDRIPYSEANGLPGRSVADVVGSFLAVCPPREEPTVVVILGGVASGKTTMRHEKYRQSHVSLDPADIYLALTQAEAEISVDIHERLETAGQEIVARGVADRRDLVFEYLADDEAEAVQLIGNLKSEGYRVQLDYLDCELDVALARNRDRDPADVSCYFTQTTLVRWLRAASAG